jgi:hypothetical protein
LNFVSTLNQSQNSSRKSPYNKILSGSKNKSVYENNQPSHRRFKSREKEQTEKVYNGRGGQISAILNDENLIRRGGDVYRVNKVLKPLQPFSKRYL